MHHMAEKPPSRPKPALAMGGLRHHLRWPRFSRLGLTLSAVCAVLLTVAAASHAPALAIAGFGVLTAVVVARLVVEAAGACGAIGGVAAQHDREVGAAPAPGTREEW